MEEIALGELHLTELQLEAMTLRTFHNLLTGRLRREKAERAYADVKHSELVVAMLSPHMKKQDREAAYREIENQAKGLAPETPKKQPVKDPIKFWENIDNKARGAKEPPIPEG